MKIAKHIVFTECMISNQTTPKIHSLVWDYFWSLNTNHFRQDYLIAIGMI